MKVKSPRIVVCAAIKHKQKGFLICGPRHGDCLNTANRHGLEKDFGSETWQCGFVDQNFEFMSREEAWKVADAAGQIRRPLGWEKNYDSIRPAGIGDEGMLFSENLY